jgi:hypothetical protein
MFEREDWTAFRTLDGLCRKAGAAQNRLARVVVKELVDNALDASGNCELSLDGSVVVVRDRGSGIPGDDEAIARLFSMSRPLTSSKFLRLPTRGALGNGLRVVVGAVAVTRGELFVATRGRKLRITPDVRTGESTAVRVGDFDEPGTRIEVVLEEPIKPGSLDLVPAERAINAARKQQKRYTGKTSPHWYDVDSFYELLMSSSKAMTVREFIAEFDGCSNAGKIVDGFSGRPARSLTREEAARLLNITQSCARVVNPKRLGALGQGAFSGAYAYEASSVILPSGMSGSRVELPIVVEAWADPHPEDSIAVFLINSTPCVAGASAWYSSKEKTTTVYGSDLRLDVKTGKTGIWLHVNIIIPYMPVTSDGKALALGMFRKHLQSIIEKAAKRARKLQPRDDLRPNIKNLRPNIKNLRLTSKAVVFEHMEEQIKNTSGDRRYRFHWRQVFYRIRPIVKNTIGEELEWNYFSQTLVTEYEKERGEERLAYRDPRGTFYAPHRGGENFPLGTLQVEAFRRPEWRFNKVLYVEKEGFFEALKADRWPERHDCALMTSKGQPTRAARDIIDLIGESDEPVQVFCLHDADAAGTLIYQSLQEETRARPRRNIKVENLGLDPAEAASLAEEGVVEVENVSYDKRQGVADYVDDKWAHWLQSHRVELNAFTTPQFIEWLDEKMADFDGKVIPPAEVLEKRLKSDVRERVRESIMERVLAEARVDDQVDQEMARLGPRLAKATAKLPDRVAEDLQDDPFQRWADAVAARAKKVAARRPAPASGRRRGRPRRERR